METLGDIKRAKKGTYFYCSDCNFVCSKKYSWNRHIATSKHKLVTNCEQMVTQMVSQKGQKGQNEQDEYGKFYCENCDKLYLSRNGLWKHKKTCNLPCQNKNSLPELTPELILTLIKQHGDYQQLIMEQNKTIVDLAKNAGTNHSHNNTNNSHNKSFNLQFFLNETCKDAMNITDFVNSLQLQLSDLERVGELGYVEGISKIIINNLKDLDITLRPVHCTDKKRETIYVKDEDKWEKDEEKKKMHKFIKKVADKNARMLPKFKESYPDYNKSSSIVSDQYNKILVESMGGFGDDDYEKEEKIIKRVSKEVIVEKI